MPLLQGPCCCWAGLLGREWGGRVGGLRRGKGSCLGARLQAVQLNVASCRQVSGGFTPTCINKRAARPARLPTHLCSTATNTPTLCHRDGTIFAYAVSYDWSRGYAEYNPTTAKNYILLHQPQEAEVKSRARVPGRR